MSQRAIKARSTPGFTQRCKNCNGSVFPATCCTFTALTAGLAGCVVMIAKGCTGTQAYKRMRSTTYSGSFDQSYPCSIDSIQAFLHNKKVGPCTRHIAPHLQQVMLQHSLLVTGSLTCACGTAYAMFLPPPDHCRQASIGQWEQCEGMDV
jgi:hypothetical protein